MGHATDLTQRPQNLKWWLPGVEVSKHGKNNQENEEAEGGLVFVVSFVLVPGEVGRGLGGVWRGGSFSGRLRETGGKARKEKRDAGGIGIESGTVLGAKFHFFPPHDQAIDQREIKEQ